MTSPALRIGFLGAGKMATALAAGWLRAGLVPADRLIASDPVAAARQAFGQDTGARTTTDNTEVAAHSDVLVLAVKPQSMRELLGQIRPAVTERHLLVSIVTGFSLQQIAELLGQAPRLIRVMPNTPCLVGASASAYAPNDRATREDVELVDRLLNAVGRAVPVPETLLDAVTGLSGSGPAFVYIIIEALSDAGVRVGLPRAIADLLAAQTVFGSAKMVLETKMHTGPLKDAVASPGGTTIAGIHALERGGLRAALMDAVEAATRRAGELGRT